VVDPHEHVAAVRRQGLRRELNALAKLGEIPVPTQCAVPISSLSGQVEVENQGTFACVKLLPLLVFDYIDHVQERRGTVTMEHTCAIVDECMWRSWFFRPGATTEQLCKGLVTAIIKHQS
jgi:hypothetical protein